MSARRFTFNLTEKDFIMKKNFKYFMFCVAALFAFHSSSILADGHAGEAKPEMMMLEPMTVNINSASSEDLAVHLKGIGLKTAQAIIDYRNENGDFSSAGDIMNVKGIGGHTFEANKDMIVVE